MRAALDCSDYQEALKLSLQIEGKSLTKQTWAIIPKIKQVDGLMTPAAQSRIREGHPEVSFAHMNGGAALLTSKHTEKGGRDRLSMLTLHFEGVTSLVQQHSRIAEDIIDACAMLWTARRILNNCALALPETPPTDARGLLMQIWA